MSTQVYKIIVTVVHLRYSNERLASKIKPLARKLREHDLVLKLLTDKELEILAFLARNPGRSAFQVSVELRITQSTVYKALNRLAREGLVKARKAEGSESWSAANQKEFRDIFTRAVDGVVGKVYK